MSAGMSGVMKTLQGMLQVVAMSPHSMDKAAAVEQCEQALAKVSELVEAAKELQRNMHIANCYVSGEAPPYEAAEWALAVEDFEKALQAFGGEG